MRTLHRPIILSVFFLAVVLMASPFVSQIGNASATMVDVKVGVGGNTQVSTGASLQVTGSIGTIVKAGTSTTHEITVSNPSDKDASFTLSVDGDAASWVSVSKNALTVKAKTSETVQVTVSPPASSAPGSYTAHINIRSDSGATQSILVKVQVPKLLVEVSPGVINIVAKPNSSVERTVLLINSADVDISRVQLTVTGDAESMIQLNTTLMPLKAQGVAEAKLKINVGSLAEGTYTGKLVVTSEDGSTATVDIVINVRMTDAPTANTEVTTSSVAKLGIEPSKDRHATATVIIEPDILAKLGIIIQAGTTANMEIAKVEASEQIQKVAEVKAEAKETSDGKLSIAVMTDVKPGTKSGIFSGTVTLETKSGAKIEIPVVTMVRAKVVANGAVRITGDDDDWRNIPVKTSISLQEGNVQGGPDKAVDIVMARVTDTSDALLISVKVVGDVDTSTRLYAVRFDVNNDGKADFTLLFNGTQAVLVDAQGKVVASVSDIAWDYKGGTLEAAVDKAQFQSTLGTSFKAQVFAKGSYKETPWFPDAQPYILGSTTPQSASSASQPSTSQPAVQPSPPATAGEPTSSPQPAAQPSPSLASNAYVLVGVIVAVVVVAAVAAIAASRRRKHAST